MMNGAFFYWREASIQIEMRIECFAVYFGYGHGLHL